MNHKGFTLVEILATITILGIISVIAIVGYSKYAESARKQAYKTMAKSASTAAEQYVMDNPGIAVETETEEKDGRTIYRIKNVDTTPGITFEELMQENYLSTTEDPGNPGTNCTGIVRVGLVETTKQDAIDTYVFVVDQCCTGHQARYTYTIELKDGKQKTFEEVTTPSNIC